MGENEDSDSDAALAEQVCILLMHGHETEASYKHIPNILHLKESITLVSN